MLSRLQSRDAEQDEEYLKGHDAEEEPAHTEDAGHLATPIGPETSDPVTTTSEV